jgi:hypothetical protein
LQIDHLVDLAQQRLSNLPTMLEYGVSQNEAIKSGIPCGVRFEVLQSRYTAHRHQTTHWFCAGSW